MKRRLMEYLACPIDKHHPLDLIIFEEDGEEITEAMIICWKCKRYYPVKDGIPEMLPDQLRDRKEDTAFLEKWKDKIPREILEEGKPYPLKK
ncbi:MAG: Trm112 family protein [Candidatus Bathyarchaeia archaeon]